MSAMPLQLVTDTGAPHAAGLPSLAGNLQTPDDSNAADAQGRPTASNHENPPDTCGAPNAPANTTAAEATDATDASPVSRDDADEQFNTSLATLIAQIHEGRVATGELPAELRQACVHHLTFEGFSNDDIAALLSISDRTVRRDRQASRVTHALSPNLRLGDELMGEYQCHTLATIRRLTRLCNDPQTPPYARLWSEESISRIYHRFITSAHSLNYFRDGQHRLREEEKAERDLKPKAPLEEHLQKLLKRMEV